MLHISAVPYSSESTEAHKVACLTALANYPHLGNLLIINRQDRRIRMNQHSNLP